MTGISFTCDVDWAPEYALEDTLAFFGDLGIELTLFATHESDVLRGSGLDVGIHPYLSRLEERAYQDEINRLKDIYPQAIGSRTHRNYFGYTLPQMLVEAGIKYDISVVTWMHECIANRHFTDLVTLTYSWEDGLHFDYSLPLSGEVLPGGDGNFVYNVHPIMIYLNADSEERRKRACHGITDLTRCDAAHLEGFINRGRGIRDVIREFVAGKETMSLLSLVRETGFDV